MTRNSTKTDQATKPEDEQDDKPLPQYLIDLDGVLTNSRSLALLVASKRCFQDQQADEEAPDAESDVQPFINQIQEHCSEMSDYLLPDTPLKEAIFRVMLAGGNEPVTAEDISQVLTEKWSLTAYPRDVSIRVIQRLLDHSSTYYIARIPEPEPEPEEEAEEAVPEEQEASEPEVTEQETPEEQTE